MASSRGNDEVGPVFRTTVRAKGQITLPDEVRRAAKLEEGDLLEIEVQEKGVIVLRQASEDIKAGRTIKFASGEELLRYLDELAEGLDS